MRGFALRFVWYGDYLVGGAVKRRAHYLTKEGVIANGMTLPALNINAVAPFFFERSRP